MKWKHTICWKITEYTQEIQHDYTKCYNRQNEMKTQQDYRVHTENQNNHACIVQIQTGL